MQAQEINIDQLVESELNPRGSYDEDSLAELAESIKSVGLLQPLTVRPIRGRSKKSKYEVVCGHRRLRAARLAGLEEVSCLVRELDDVAAAFVALVENSQRQDVSPIEEAAAIRRLVDAGVDVEEIAARLARPVRFVQHRYQLTRLTEDLQALVRGGRLPLAGAVRLAALAVDMQLEVVESFKRYAADSVFSVSTVNHVIDFVTRSLAKVPWGLDDEGLNGCMACSICPLRTGAQGDLFEDSGADRCLDRACFDGKKTAWLDDARLAGVEVREGYVSAKAISADQVYVKDANGSRVLFEPDIPKVIYKSPDGRVTLAYDRAVLAPVLREAGYQDDAESMVPARATAEDKEQKKEWRTKTEAFELAVGGILEQYELQLHVAEWGTEGAIRCDLVPALVLMALRMSHQDTRVAVCKRRGITPHKGQYSTDYFGPMQDYAKGLPVTEQWQFFLELLARQGGGYQPSYHGDKWPDNWMLLREVVYGNKPAGPNADVNEDGEVIDAAGAG